MARVFRTAVIEAPVERVFDYRLDVRNLPSYNPSVTNLIPVAERADLDVGARYTFRVRLAPLLHVRCTLTIARIERPRLVEFSISSWIDATEVCVFEPVESGRATRVRFETVIDTPGGWIAPLANTMFVVPFAGAQIDGELARLRSRLSSRG